jgi:plastocyanin
MSLLMSGCAEAPRDIVLLARGMRFVVPEQPELTNPVIPVRAGERVRLVLRNEAPGLLHDIQIPAWHVKVAQIRAGQTAEVTFTVPKRLGRTEYRCQPHGELMKGFVEVTP